MKCTNVALENIIHLYCYLLQLVSGRFPLNLLCIAHNIQLYDEALNGTEIVSKRHIKLVKAGNDIKTWRMGDMLFVNDR